MEQRKIGADFGRVMVMVPHQDDELLMCAGILRHSVLAKLPILVVMVTNGDYGSPDEQIGRERLRETLAGLAVLGVKPEQVELLGYADTGMEKEASFLTKLYEAKDGERVWQSHCSDHTYGLEEKPEYHKKRGGQSAAYTRNNLVTDLTRVMMDFRPDHIFTTSEYDLHGDHSALFLFVRDILENMEAEGEPTPALYSAVVHSMAGDENWPVRSSEITAYTCPDFLEEKSTLKWQDRISFAVPADMNQENREKNRKYRALSKHVTALKPDAVDYLYAFVKNEELFWLLRKEGKKHGTA